MKLFGYFTRPGGFTARKWDTENYNEPETTIGKPIPISDEEFENKSISELIGVYPYTGPPI